MSVKSESGRQEDAHRSDKDSSYGSNGADSTDDGCAVPIDARNWPRSKKTLSIAVLGFLCFQVPIGSSIIGPAVPQIQDDFGNHNELLFGFVVSIYVLGFAFGPLIFAPASEIWGRRIIYNVCNVLTLAMTIGSALAPSLGALMVLRFLTGCFGSVPMSVGGGTVADIAYPEDRGKYLALVAVAPIVGPVIGAVIGGFLAESKGWRWCLWLMAIMSGAGTLMTVFLFPETYAPKLNQQQRTSNTARRATFGRENRRVFRKALARPFKILIFCPVAAPMALHLALMHAYIYVLFAVFPSLYQNQYHFSTGLSGLAYIGIGIGDLLGAAIVGKTSDRISTKLAARSPSGQRSPESRLILLAALAPLVPIGLLWTGWAAQEHTHWIVPELGSVPLGIGLIGTSLCGQIYMVDSFTNYAASAVAATTFLRSIMGAVLPLASGPLFAKLGFGLGNTVLACVSLLSVIMGIYLLSFGKRLRENHPLEVEGMDAEKS